MPPALLLAVLFAVQAASEPPPSAKDDEVAPMEQVLDRLDLFDVRLLDALRLLSEETGVNLVASPAAADRRVSIYLRDVTVREAVETLAKANGLWFREEADGRIVRLLTGEEFERDLVLFREEETRVFTLLYPNAVDVALAVRNLFGDRVRLQLDTALRFDDFVELSQRFQKFDLLEQRAQSLGIFTGGQTTTTFGGGFGGGTFGGTAFTRFSSPFFSQSLLGSQTQGPTRTEEEKPTGPPLTPSQMEALEREAEGGALDRAAIERVRGRKTSIFVTIVRRNNQIAVRSSDARALDEIERIVEQLDVPSPQVLLEMRILSLDLGEEFDSVFDVAYDGGSDDVSFSTGDIEAGGGLVDPTALVWRYVNGAFRARLQLLESRGRVTTLATPLLLVANNEVARLFVGEERPILRNVSSQTTVNQSTGFVTTSPTVEVRPVGTTLLITPNVNADRTVTLRVIQETSSIKEGDAQIPVQTDESGTLTPFPVDVVSSRTINATVVGKDGHTVALGGLVEESVRKVRKGIPLLMDLPFVGALFRRQEDDRSRRELVVLIRPHVLFTAPEGLERTRRLAESLSIHPSAASLGQEPLDTFAPHEAPRGGAEADPLEGILDFQSDRPASGAPR